MHNLIKRNIIHHINKSTQHHTIQQLLYNSFLTQKQCLIHTSTTHMKQQLQQKATTIDNNNNSNNNNDTTITSTTMQPSGSASVPNATHKNIPLGSPEGIPGCNMSRITAYDIKQAYKRIKEYIPKSPLDISRKLSTMLQSNIYLKKEHLSMTGSYKERGALNKLLLLNDEEKKHGVICASAGNHAQAVSYHTSRMGISGVICMPENTPHVKVKATRSFGGRVVLYGDSFTEAFSRALDIAKHEGRTFIHAFNDSDIIAGQGTVAIELLEQNPFLEAVVIPIGGGGLAAGMSLLIKSINPNIKIYGVETSAMPGMKQSVEAGHVVSVPKQPTMGDGIAIETIGLVPFEYIKQYVDDIVTVDEDELAAAVLLLMENEKTICEGSGAAAVAALMHNKLPQLKDKQVAAICSGGNIDMTLVGRIIDKGLFKSGRLTRIHVSCLDVPGQLCRVLEIVKSCRANIRDLHHERAFLLESIGQTQPVIVLETRDFEHIQEVVDGLNKAGFRNVYVDVPANAPLTLPRYQTS